MTEAREHHAIFAHQLIPQFLFEETEGFINALLSPRADEVLIDMWQDLPSQVEVGEVLPHDGLRCESVTSEEMISIRIDLPAATQPGEARHVCIFALVEDDELEVRYASVECDAEDPEKSVAAEQFADGTREEYGAFEVPDKKQIAPQLLELILSQAALQD